MKIKSISPAGKFEEQQITESINGIINQTNLCSYSTITQTEDGPKSHIATAFYCMNKSFDFYILTAPSTQHGINVENNDSVALAIYNTNQSWNNPKQGLQLFGTMSKTSLLAVPEAFTVYIKDYPGLLNYLKHPSEIVDKLESRFYTVKISKVKIFDESTFGSEVWIDVILE